MLYICHGSSEVRPSGPPSVSPESSHLLRQLREAQTNDCVNYVPNVIDLLEMRQFGYFDPLPERKKKLVESLIDRDWRGENRSGLG